MARRSFRIQEQTIDVGNIVLGDLRASVHLARLERGRQQLHRIAQRARVADLAQCGQRVLVDLQALGGGAQPNDLSDLGDGVRQRANDEQPIEQVQRNAVRRDDVIGAAAVRE